VSASFRSPFARWFYKNASDPCSAAFRASSDSDCRFEQLVKRHPSMLKNMTIVSLE
jgi:hypothetical protein